MITSPAAGTSLASVRCIPASQARVRASPASSFPDESTTANPRVPVTRMIAGCAATSRATASDRQFAHAAETRLKFAFQTGMSAGVQADIVRLRSFQPRSMAICSTAGNQLSAWLSPNSAIVFWDARLP